MKLVKKMINNHIDFYDVGYRLIKKYWGKGFATESALASVEYGFEKLNTQVIYATADSRHISSKNVLKKCGLKYLETFNDAGCNTDWFRIKKIEWQATNSDNKY